MMQFCQTVSKRSNVVLQHLLLQNFQNLPQRLEGKGINQVHPCAFLTHRGESGGTGTNRTLTASLYQIKKRQESYFHEILIRVFKTVMDCLLI